MSEAEGAAQAQPETTSEFWLGNDNKDWASSKGWDDPDKAPSLAQSYRDLEKKLGSEIRLPDELTDEHKSKIFSKLGRPESPDKYELSTPEGVQLDDDLVSSFRQFAHGLNLTSKQFNDVVNFQIDAMLKAMQVQEDADQKTKADAAAALKEEWKENYDGNFKKAKESAEKLGILDAMEELGFPRPG